MWARKNNMGGITTASKDSLFMVIPLGKQPMIPGPSVGYNCCSWQDNITDKAPQARARNVGHLSQPNSTEALRLNALHSYGHNRLAIGLSSANTLFLSADVGFINLNASAEHVTPRPDHNPTEFVQPSPCSLIAAQAEHLLQAKSAHSRFLVRDVPYCLKPHPQRFSCTIKQGSGSDRNLTTADGTMKQTPSSLPRLAMRTYRTPKAIWPAKASNILSAIIFGHKPCVKFLKRPGVVFSAHWMSYLISYREYHINLSEVDTP